MALFDYDSDHDDDLSFTEGAIIEVLAEEVEGLGPGWMIGRMLPEDASTEPDQAGGGSTGMSGFFPANYVERQQNLLASSTATAAGPLAAIDDVGDDNLSAWQQGQQRTLRNAHAALHSPIGTKHSAQLRREEAVRTELKRLRPHVRAHHRSGRAPVGWGAAASLCVCA